MLCHAGRPLEKGCEDGDLGAHAATLHPPDPNLGGSAAALAGPAPCLLPACGGSGWPSLRGQGMLEQSWAARPGGQRGGIWGWPVSVVRSQMPHRGGVSQDGCRILPGLSGADRALAMLVRLVQLWKVGSSAAGDEGGTLPGASRRDGSRDPIPGL